MIASIPCTQAMIAKQCHNSQYCWIKKNLRLKSHIFDAKYFEGKKLSLYSFLLCIIYINSQFARAAKKSAVIYLKSILLAKNIQDFFIRALEVIINFKLSNFKILHYNVSNLTSFLRNSNGLCGHGFLFRLNKGWTWRFLDLQNQRNLKEKSEHSQNFKSKYKTLTFC